MAAAGIRACAGLLPAVLVAALAAGCAHRPGADDAYADWVTVTTEHFDVHTPLGAATAEELGHDLEDIYQALRKTFFATAALAPVEVVVVREPGDARAAAADASGPSHERKPAGGVLVLATRGPHVRETHTLARSSTPLQEAAVRDLVERFLRETLPHPPSWFHQGFKAYLEAVQVDPGEAKFGRRDPLLRAELGQARVVPLGELLGAGKEAFRGEWARRHRASAWGFVHYLLNAEEGRLRPRFDAIAAALRPGGGDVASSRAVVEQAFPDVPFATLEQRVRDYSVEQLGRKDGFAAFAVALPPPPPTKGTAVPAASGHIRDLLLSLKR